MGCFRHVIINVSNVEKYLVASWHAVPIGVIIHSIMVDVEYATVQRPFECKSARVTVVSLFGHIDCSCKCCAIVCTDCSNRFVTDCISREYYIMCQDNSFIN
jgi:hypothetical protein